MEEAALGWFEGLGYGVHRPIHVAKEADIFRVQEVVQGRGRLDGDGLGQG